MMIKIFQQCHPIITEENKEKRLKLVEEMKVLKIKLKDNTTSAFEKDSIIKENKRIQGWINQIREKS